MNTNKNTDREGPVARFVCNESNNWKDEVEWLVHQGSPLKDGDLLYARPQQAAQVAQPLTEEREDYLHRLIAGVRRMIDQDPETIKAREECGEEYITGTWIDASLLCRVVENDVLHLPAYSIGKDQA